MICLKCILLWYIFVILIVRVIKFEILRVVLGVGYLKYI